MSLEYDYHRREFHSNWHLIHCEVLLSEAKKYKNTSLVLYAALEATRQQQTQVA